MSLPHQHLERQTSERSVQEAPTSLHFNNVVGADGGRALHDHISQTHRIEGERTLANLKLASAESLLGDSHGGSSHAVENLLSPKSPASWPGGREPFGQERHAVGYGDESQRHDFLGDDKHPGAKRIIDSYKASLTHGNVPPIQETDLFKGMAFERRMQDLYSFDHQVFDQLKKLDPSKPAEENKDKLKEIFQDLNNRKPPQSWQEYGRMNKFYNKVQQAFGIKDSHETLGIYADTLPGKDWNSIAD